MIFFYHLPSGRFYTDTINLGKGYSGKGEGLNNPALTARRRMGPIPVGLWQIERPRSHPTLGPVSLPLKPVDVNTERSAFYIHGDNSKGDFSASEGCIILPRAVREVIADNIPAMLIVHL